MPVPTETFRSTTKLNLIFAASALALLGSVGWMVFDDYNREFRQWQRRGRLWQVAMTRDSEQRANDQTTDSRIKRLERQIDQITAELGLGKSKEQIQKLQAQIAEFTSQRDRLALKTASLKGQIGPFNQQIQVAELSGDSDLADSVREKLRNVEASYSANNDNIVTWEEQIEQKNHELNLIRAQKKLLESRKNQWLRKIDALREKLDQLDPPTLWGKTGEKVRNAPLLDWLNPSEKPQQVVVPEVLMDLNTHLIESIDRCQSCHVNIDNPDLGRRNVISYAQRQVAHYEKQQAASLDPHEPVVLLQFWLDAIATIGTPLPAKRDGAVIDALQRLNELRTAAGQDPLPEPDKPKQKLALVLEQFDAIKALSDDSDAAVRRSQWYAPMAWFAADLKALLKDHLGDEQFTLLAELYRNRLLETLNGYRRSSGLPPLDTNPAMLAHPRLDLFVDVESKHPMKKMGCTVCHEGSGQETIFEHTVHSPRDVWVDARTGATIPDVLIGHVGDHVPAPAGKSPKHQVAAADVAHIVLAADAPQRPHGDGDEGHQGQESIFEGVNLSKEIDAAPFAPAPQPHDHVAFYTPPGGDGTQHRAVRQVDFWKKAYGWTHVHFMHWEKPMHKLDYVESGCNKCHTEVYDVKDQAPRLFEGRRLFAQLGCANCHAVSDLEDDLDVRRVGPSLVHLKHKLSKQMIASWVWAPKAFRPTTRMPHYFMLENNSSPLDVLRTRVEVAAITKYLLNAEPGPSVQDDPPTYEPVSPPDEPGDAERGRTLFHQVGCLACHTNLNETGQRWIVQDFVERAGLSPSDAQTAYMDMSYNARHQYVLAHLDDKLQQTGPELSGVGTKLLAGRGPEEATAWLFNWLTNPRNYHSYSIMPKLHLTAQEAADISAYLLSQTRPDYDPASFDLDERIGKQMLKELVVNLLAGQSTPTLARRSVEEDPQKWSQENQLMFLGRKMITHYGCNGCHAINGFEQAVSACTKLDGWGMKNPHMIDFGNFEHAYDKIREKPWNVWTVQRNGLESDAPQIDQTSERIERRSVDWEHIENERRPWLYHKLHNTRAYDRGRTSLDGEARIDEGGQLHVGNGYRPYDKLKMPRYYLKDDQIQALVTYVTSIRKPLVSPQLQQVADDAGQRVTRGRQIATRYNCYGCHNIEGNSVHLHQYFDVYNEDGTYNDDALNWAPPRLLGQGAKTRPDWLFGFLQNVETIRPWLRVRMPSFAITQEEAGDLVGYFAGHSVKLSAHLTEQVKSIDSYRAQLLKQKDTLAARLAEVGEQESQFSQRKADGDPIAEAYVNELVDERADIQAQIADLDHQHATWFDAVKIKAAVDEIGRFGDTADLTRPQLLDPRHTDNELRRENWDKLLKQMCALADVFDTHYPYTPKHEVDASGAASADAHFLRGTKLFVELGCQTGLCHRIGDERLLAEKNMLVPTTLEEAMGGGEDEEGYEEEGYDEEGYDEEGEEGYGDEGGYEDDEEGYGDDEDADDEEGYGDDEAVTTGPSVAVRPDGPPGGAPNMRLVAERLQPRWTRKWLTYSDVIQPGTRMQQYFKEGPSHFAAFPPDTRKDKEQIYGYTNEQQSKLLMDFLYTAGPRRLTLSNTGEPLDGQAMPPVELKPLEPPPPGQMPDAASSQTPQSPDMAPSAPPPAPAPPPPKTSQIPNWHDEASAPYEGEPLRGHKTRVIGTIVLDGKRARMSKLKMNVDRACAAANTDPVYAEELVVSDDGKITNALIHVKAGLPPGAVYDPPPKADIHQIGCVYRPHVTALMVNQTVNIWNDDNTAHNVKITPRQNQPANFNQPAAGIKNNLKLPRPELSIPMTCTTTTPG